MSYQVLARKWRPQRFDQVVGQQHVLSALENGLREQRLHHAYLFSGTRGVGKTSIARLFAKGLNCERGITATPCGECANCKAIEQGRFIDLIEIDGASRTKIEDTRELLDNVQYKPTVGRFKVYLIDEVHMLSRHSFNALLKTLEEPPEYVKFLLATTDPQKLPITILSRCMQFHLRALDQSTIQQHLEFILTQENIPFESIAVAKLAKSAQGSIRDSLSLTDQAIAVSNGNITLPIVSQMLGLIDDHHSIDLIQAIAQADGEKAMNVIQAIAEKGIDWVQLLSNVAETLHQIAMLQLLANKSQEESPLHFLAKILPPEDVQFYYQLMLNGKKELPFAPEPRLGVEMTILRALAFHPKNIENLVTPTLPVVSQQPPVSHTQQNINQLRERLGQQTSTRPNNTIGRPQSIPTPPQTAKTVEYNLPEPTTPLANSSSDMGNSAIEAMIKARQQLQRSREQVVNQNEKKKSEPIAPILASRQAKGNLQKQLMSMADQSHQSIISSHQNQTAVQQQDEGYRWQWLDPQLAKQNETTKPSDIKQAILQERTPELVEKTIAISAEEDEWCNIINRLHLGGLSRQIALNSVLQEKQDQSLKLLLKPSMAHLDTEESRQSLTAALQAIGLTFDLTVGEDNSLQTPLEYRRSIFEKLTEEAKHALFADEKLKMLRDTFEAEIDESTIRAV